MEKRRCMVLHKEDDVAVMLEHGQAGDWIEVAGTKVALRAAVPRFHKIALRVIAAGQPVRKAGEVIGVMTRAVEPGDYVHIHNIRSQREGAADLTA